MTDLAVSWPDAGRYVVAVSGGADSMELLDVMAGAASTRGYELVVAHFDHGLRAESAEDASFVAAAAARYGLPFETHAAALGRASEATARAARHAWLHGVRARAGAVAILIAHHQDDLLETSLLNLARGSGRLGLAPMSEVSGGGSDGHILRPLLGVSRTELRAYAHAREIAWREDPTNADTTNPRNFLRHKLLPAATPAWRTAYLEKIAKLAELNTKITQSISSILEPAQLNPHTYQFTIGFMRSLSADERQELILAAARSLKPGIELGRPLITEIAEFATLGHSGTYRPLRQSLVLEHKNRYVLLTTNAVS